jgi:hypothetical protein
MMNTPDDDLRSQLHSAATSIDPGDLSLEGVRATARRRSLLTRAGAVVGVLGLVSAGVVAFVAAQGPGDPGTLRSAAPTTPESTQAPESTVAVDDTVATTLPEPTTPSVTVEVVQRPGMPGQPAGVGGAPDYGEWSSAWGDGFLVGTQTFEPRPLPEELPEEIVALFPPEVVELFDGELPPTIDEATDMLSEAGLLDVVADIIAENQEAYDAIYSVPADSDGPTLDVRFTTDGVTWEPIEMTAPPGASYFSSVATVGDRLVVAYSTADPMLGTSSDGVVRIASSADLANWDVQEVVTPPPATFPAGITWSADIGGFAANESGWVASVYSGVNVNPEELLDAELQPVLADGEFGFNYSFDETGVTIERSGPATVTTTVVDDPDGTGPDDTDPEPYATVPDSVPDVPETTTYTWEELGIAPDVAAYLGNQRYEPALWSSTWDGTPTPAGVDTGTGQVVATSAGFLRTGDGIEFSPDGIAWTAVELPVDDAYVSGAFAFDGGVILLVAASDGGTQVYRTDATGGSPVLLDVPGLPEFVQSAHQSTSNGAIVLDSAEPPPPTPPPLVVEYEGHRITIDSASGTIEIVDTETGETVGEANTEEYGRETEGNVALGDDGVTVTDPDSGEVIVSFPADVLDAAYEELYAELDDGSDDYYEYRPDTWLMGSQDGLRFLLVDLDDGPDAYVGTVARSGSKVLIQFDEAWAVYDLP